MNINLDKGGQEVVKLTQSLPHLSHSMYDALWVFGLISISE